MPRPPKAPRDRLSHSIRAHFTPDQFRLVAGKAREAGLELSPFLRRLAVEGRVDSRRIPAVNLDAVHQIRRLGNNLNQLARYFNSHPEDDERDVKKRVAELRAVLGHLERELLGWSAEAGGSRS